MAIVDFQQVREKQFLMIVQNQEISFQVQEITHLFQILVKSNLFKI
jgi:hypothetical protein